MSMGLMTNETRLLEFLRNYSAAHHGVMPSVAEMTEAMGLKSKSGVSRMLVSLEGRGAIRRLPSRVRAIEIVNHSVVDDDTRRALLLYCSKTRAVPRLIVAEALAEYFAKRGFVPEAR